MNKILIVFFVTYVFSADMTWEHQHRFVLKKDEVAKIVTQISNKKDSHMLSFDFRWTLYAGENIIIHTKYNNFPRQHVLSLRRGLETYMQLFLQNSDNFSNDEVKLLLVFEEFDKKNKLATFDIFIEDRKSRLAVNFIDPIRK